MQPPDVAHPHCGGLRLVAPHRPAAAAAPSQQALSWLIQKTEQLEIKTTALHTWRAKWPLGYCCGER